MTIFWYLCRTNIMRTGAVLLILFAIVMLGRFARYLKMATQNDIDPELIPTILFWNLPNVFFLLLPLALMLGVGLSVLRAHAEGELLAWYNCGLSRTRLALTLLVPAITALPLTLCLSLWWLPAANKHVELLVDGPDKNYWQRHISDGALEFAGKRTVFGELGDYDHNYANLRDVVLIDHVSGGSKDARDEGIELTLADDGLLSVHDAENIFVDLGEGITYKDYHKSLALDISEFASLRRFLERSEARRRRVRDGLEFQSTTALWRTPTAPARNELWWRWIAALMAPLLSSAALILMGGVRLSRTISSSGLFYIMLVYWLVMSSLLSAREWDFDSMLAVHGFWIGAPLLGALLLGVLWRYRLGAAVDAVRFS